MRACPWCRCDSCWIWRWSESWHEILVRQAAGSWPALCNNDFCTCCVYLAVFPANALSVVVSLALIPWCCSATCGRACVSWLLREVGFLRVLHILCLLTPPQGPSTYINTLSWRAMPGQT